MRLRIQRLQIRIALLTLIVFIPIVGLIALSSNDAQQFAITEAEEDVVTLAQRIAADNQQYIESTRLLLLALSRYSAIRERDVDRCNVLLGDLIQELTRYASLFVIDGHTHTSFCNSSGNRTPVNSVNFEWYQAAIQTRGFTVSEYRIGPVTNESVITLAQPIYDQAGMLDFVLGASLSLQWLNDFLMTTELPESAVVTLMDRRGVVLARYPNDPSWIGEIYRNDPIRETALAMPSGTVRGQSVSGSPYIFGFSSLNISQGQMHIVVGMSEAEVLAPSEAQRNRNFLFLAAVVAFGIGFAWLSGSFIILPIKSLTEAIQEIAAGKLHARVELHSEMRELNDLISAFDYMAATLEAEDERQVDKLTTTNQRLRHEISERQYAEERSDVLRHLSAALSEVLTASDVAYTVIHKGLIPIGCHLGAVALYNPKARSLRIVARHRDNGIIRVEPNEVIPLPENESIAKVFNDGEPVWVDSETSYQSRFPDTIKLDTSGAAPIRAAAYLPLIVGKVPIGCILAAFPHERILDDTLRNLLRTITEYCAQTLERSRLFEEEAEARLAAEQAAARVLQLQVMTASLAESITFEDVHKLVILQGATFIRADMGTFYLVEKGKWLKPSYSFGLTIPEGYVDPYSAHAISGDTPAGFAVLHQEAVWFDSTEAMVQRFPALSVFPTINDYQAQAFLPLIAHDQVLGLAVFGFKSAPDWNDADQQVMLALMVQGAQTLERVRLAEEAKEAVKLHERQRLARDLHDAVSQTLFSSALIAEGLPARWIQKPEETSKLLEELMKLNKSALAEMRTLLIELRPEAVARTALPTLFRQLIDAACGRRDINASLEVHGGLEALPPDVHEMFYRIAQESVNNIIKHSQATEIRIHLIQDAQKAMLSVTDNGIGFDPDLKAIGFGLENMRERAEAVGASVEIESEVGRGTSVTVIWHTQRNDQASENGVSVQVS